jgi:hypothetical protein
MRSGFCSERVSPDADELYGGEDSDRAMLRHVGRHTFRSVRRVIGAVVAPYGRGLTELLSVLPQSNDGSGRSIGNCLRELEALIMTTKHIVAKWATGRNLRT